MHSTVILANPVIVRAGGRIVPALVVVVVAVMVVRLLASLFFLFFFELLKFHECFLRIYVNFNFN